MEDNNYTDQYINLNNYETVVINTAKCWEINNNLIIGTVYLSNDYKINKIPVELPSNITVLICDDNILTELPKIPNSIKGLSCRYNMLSDLSGLYDIENSLLERIECSNNNIYNIDIPMKLKKLYANTNKLTTINEFYYNINEIILNNNKFTEIPYIFNEKYEYKLLYSVIFSMNPIKYISIPIINMIKNICEKYRIIQNITDNNNFVYLSNTPFSINYCNTHCDKYCDPKFCNKYQEIFN